MSYLTMVMILTTPATLNVWMYLFGIQSVLTGLLTLFLYFGGFVCLCLIPTQQTPQQDDWGNRFAAFILFAAIAFNTVIYLLLPEPARALMGNHALRRSWDIGVFMLCLPLSLVAVCGIITLLDRFLGFTGGNAQAVAARPATPQAAPPSFVQLPEQGNRFEYDPRRFH